MRGTYGSDCAGAAIGGLSAVPYPERQTAEVDVQLPPLSIVHGQMDTAEMFAERVEVLVNRLIGPMPQNSDGSKDPNSAGELHALADRAQYVERRLRKANAELQRLFDTL